MTYLSHELEIFEAESQRYDETIAQLNASAAKQDQIAVTELARAAATRADATRLNAQAADFQAQAAAAEVQADDFEQQIMQHSENAPDEMIGRWPNPEWYTWKGVLDDLTRQRDERRSAAAADRALASQRTAAATQAQAAAVVADNNAATASANAAQLRQQAGQVTAQKDLITPQIATVVRWRKELAGQPLDRNALETVGRELTTRIDVLERQFAVAIDAAMTAEQRHWYVQTLITELSTKINTLIPQLNPAKTEIDSATDDLANLQLRIQHVMQRQPE